MKRMMMVAMAMFIAPVALADAEAEWKYREAVMKSIGGHMSAMGTILKNGVHMEDLVMHANGLAALADIAPEVFPEGSRTPKSHAKPGIWENRALFDGKMSDFVAAAEGMASAARSGSPAEIGPAIQALGGTCKGCHDEFKSD